MRYARAGASSFTNKPYPEDADSWEDMMAPIRDQLEVTKDITRDKPQSNEPKTDKPAKNQKNNKRKHLSEDTNKSKLLKSSGGIVNNTKSLVKQYPSDLLENNSKESKAFKSINKVHKENNTSKGLHKQCPPAKKSKPSPVQKRTKDKAIRTSSGSFAVCKIASDKVVKSDSSSESDNESSSDSDTVSTTDLANGNKKMHSKNKPTTSSSSSSESDSESSPAGTTDGSNHTLKIQAKNKPAKSDGSTSDSDSSEDSDASTEGTNKNKLQLAVQARTKSQYGENKARDKSSKKPAGKGAGKDSPRRCVKFGRHVISVEAFKEITELKKKWKAEGRPDDVIEEAVKLRARRDEKMRKHHKQKMAKVTCFSCQETGHVIADCPHVTGDGASSTTGGGVAGICYSCGSTEHTSKHCKRQFKSEKKQVFTLATCFRCNKSGHIARQCEENTCFTCGQHGHIQRHCPKAGTGVKNLLDKE